MKKSDSARYPLILLASVLAYALASAIDTTALADVWTVGENSTAEFDEAGLETSREATRKIIDGRASEQGLREVTDTGTPIRPLRNIVNVLEDLNSQSGALRANRVSCGGTVPAGRAEEFRQCNDAYSRLFSQPVVDIPIFLGYMDQKNCKAEARSVLDRAIEASMVETFKAPCAPGGHVQSCGFREVNPTDPRDRGMATVLEKSVPAPDGGMRTVRITLRHSAVTPDDERNRGNVGASAADAADVARRQREHSAYMRQTFQSALSSSSAVFYLGHARYGRGPDFGPEPMHIDSSGKRSTCHMRPGQVTEARAAGQPIPEACRLWAGGGEGRPGVDVMTAGLGSRQANGPPHMVGVFACDSQAHYASDLRTAANNDPSLGLMTVTTATTSMAANARTTIAAIDGLLGQRCERELGSSLSASRFSAKGHEVPGFRSSGFFH